DPRALGESADHPFTEEDWIDAHRIANETMPCLRQDGVSFPYKINGMFSFTVDGMPIMGETPVGGFWVAAALWVTNAGGAGKAIAEWMTYGEPGVDMRGIDVNRFLDYQTTDKFISVSSAKAYKEVHDVIHPAQWSSYPRNIRHSPLHIRHLEQNAQLLNAAGLEIPYWINENQRLLEKYEDQVPAREGWGAQYWDRVQGAEHLAMRDSVGMFDLTSLAIIEVEGPNAEKFMDYMFTNRMNFEVGNVVYSLLCTPKGGIKRDVAVSRNDDETYWVFTGNATMPLEKAWFEQHADGFDVTISEKSKTYAAIGLFGPNARKVLEKVTTADVSNEGFPFYTWQNIEIGMANVFAMRISYVGELGWEFHMPMDQALAIRDELWEAGQEFGLVQCGVGAMRSMRVEKGYRVWGGDIYTEHNPYEAGMGWIVKLKKESDFVGKEALTAIRADIKTNGLKRRLVTISIDSPAAVPTGNEPVFGTNGSSGKVVGQITTGGYGYSVGKYIAFGYLPIEYTKPGTQLEVEYLTERYPAQVEADCLFDPQNERMRA
ncbi:MAG: glycine cleavage T C-terminal barrel domain-containing protein, partial [Chloroflexota bacterium]